MSICLTYGIISRVCESLLFYSFYSDVNLNLYFKHTKTSLLSAFSVKTSNYQCRCIAGDLAALS
ncbi:hypothetical protein LOK49_LG11G00988 [Camellia lanceoleosa]|uniref:Uncharacterized protein n=1 Tax=Camellia lanceoleosa TaxID=1840588 RepID=A0ACC0FYJ6_9ERIC|nr:hypothetical protein LOK49_LG11G00988 [Camellia lanceoleosa]